MSWFVCLSLCKRTSGLNGLRLSLRWWVVKVTHLCSLCIFSSFERVQEAFFSAEVVWSVFDACFAHSFDDGFAAACDTWQHLTPCDKPGPKQGMQTLHAEQPAFHPPLGTPNAWHFVSFFDWDSCVFFRSKNIIPKQTKLESSRDPSAISARWNSNRPGPYLTLHGPLVAKLGWKAYSLCTISTFSDMIFVDEACCLGCCKTVLQNLVVHPGAHMP